MRPIDGGLPPNKQSIPPLFVFGVAFWASTAMALRLLRTFEIYQCLAIAGIFLLTCIAGMILYFRGFETIISVGLLGIACGIVLAGSHAASQHEQWKHVPDDGYLEVRALEDALDYGSGPTFAAEVVSASSPGLKVQAMLPQGSDCPFYGETIFGEGRWSSLSDVPDLRLWEKGQVAKVYIGNPETYRLPGLFSSIVQARIGVIDLFDDFCNDALKEGAFLMQALLCGYRGNLAGTELYEDFKSTGIVHLIAVSGSHLTLVALGANLLLKLFRIDKRISLLVLFLLIVSYLVFTACSASSIRAAVMALAALLSFFALRKSAPLAAIGLASVLFVLYAPSNALSVSFLLSALSTTSIVLFAPLLDWWLRHCGIPMPQFIRDSLSMTLASFILTTAYSSALFNQLSLVAIVANVIAAPLFAPLCLLGVTSVLLSSLIPMFASYALFPAMCGGSLFCELAHLLASIPYASVSAAGSTVFALAGSGVAAAALWWAWPTRVSKRNVCLVACLILVVICPQVIFSARNEDRIVMLDVGQGDAILIQSNNAAVLVDTGTNDAMIREALAHYGIFHLDAIFVTHGDDDHMGSLDAVSRVCEIDAIGLSEPTFTCDCDSCLQLVASSQEAVGAQNLIGLQVGDRINVGDFSLDVLWPHSFSNQGGNEDSLCFLVSYAANDDRKIQVALLLGDAESNQLSEMLEAYDIVGIPIVKVGHHGSKAALSQELAQELRSQIALIGAGVNNRYGHPSEECLSFLQEAGTEVFRTDIHGNISCSLTEEGKVRVHVG